MAHGNFSDLIFLALLVIAIQLLAFQDSLITGSGALIDDNNNSDTSILMSCAGALFIMIGTMFSGVKWDAINGKLAGIGCLAGFLGISYCTYDLDGGLVPNFLYVHALVLLAGGIHIFFFPSNAVPERPELPGPKGFICKGVFSDYANENFNMNIVDTFSVLLCLVAVGIMYDPFYLMKPHNMALYVEHYLYSVPLLTPGAFSNPAVYMLIKFTCFLTMVIASILSSVQWQPINGKLAGLGGFVACGTISYVTYKTSVGFVLKPTYEFAALLLCATIKIFAVPGHPMPLPVKKDTPAQEKTAGEGEKKEGLAESLLP